MKKDILICALIVIACLMLRMVGNSLPVIPDELAESFKDETGVAYLSDTDSYLYLRYAEQIARGENVAGINQDTDDLRTTPYKLNPVNAKRDSFNNGMSYLGAAAITIAGWFGYTNAAGVVSFLNMLLGALAAVPAYIFVRRRTNTWGAIAAGVSSALAVSFVSHTVSGFFDTDCILAVLPLTMMCCFAESLFVDSTKKGIAWIIGGMLAFVGIAVSWGSYTGYYFILFGCCLVLGVASLLFGNLFPRKNIKTLLIIVASATVVALIISGPGLFNTVLGILNRYSGSGSAGAAGTGAAGQALVFPSATLFTSELSDIAFLSGGLEGTFNVVNYGIINRLGGFGLVVAVLVFMVVGYFLSILALRKQKETVYSLADSPNQNRRSITIRQIDAENKKRKIEVSRDLRVEWAVELAIFGTWLLGTLIMLSRGVRFIELPALPLSVVFGLGIGHLTKSIKDNNIDKLAAQYLYMSCAIVVCGSLLQVDVMWAQIIGVVLLVYGLLIRNKTNIVLIIALCFSMLISPVIGTYKIAQNSIPTVTDAFESSSKWIKENTAKDAVLASWWDYGYYFEEAAERRCVADGGTTNGEMFYYLASALMEKDPEKAAETLKKVAYYKGDGDEDVYLIISRDMLDKLGAIGYYGTWDFEKLTGTSGYFYSTLNSVEVKPGQSVSVYLPTLDGYGINYTITEDGVLNVNFISEGGAVQDVSRLRVIQDGKIVYDKEVEHEYEAAPGLIVMEENGRFSAALTNQESMDSMIIKLFLSDGSFTDVFEQVNISTLDSEAVGEASRIQRLLGGYYINLSSTTGVVVYKIK